MADLDATETDVTLSMPSFATKAMVAFRGDANSDTDIVNLKTRTNGSSSEGFIVLRISDSTDAPDTAYGHREVMTDSSQKIEVWFSEAGDHQEAIKTGGYYFPKGM
jgi:hypothetical protein